ncbi:P-loop containing nucleoside triphosphate hydrolase protein [Pholiota molesta]|nr:P-loop containing nucleoside triphosphate hydrolase protein [Pholiota molesta]
MAPTKKANGPSKTRSSSSSGVSLAKVKGENFYRDAKKVNRLKMLTGGKAVRDKDGKIVQAAAFQKGEDETKPGRVQPDKRKYQSYSQTALDHFRTSLGAKKDDPYSVLLRRNKLPMALLDDAANPALRKATSSYCRTEPFSETFGPKAQRKRPRVAAGTFEELGKWVAASASGTVSLTHADFNEPIYAKGTSRRIFGELYKVIDSSDVILHILDARDPLGTMCESVLETIKKEKSHKQVVLVINKCDLVPNWVTARYIKHLTPRYPTIAFHASPNHSFGKGSLIQLLRQFSQLHADKKQISVGFIGYPNVGKSSVINTLKSSKVCTVAPVPGETKVWQYITLTKRIYLIDCPVLSRVRERLAILDSLEGRHPSRSSANTLGACPALMQRVKPIYLSRTYGIPLPNKDDITIGWDTEDFLDQLARKKGRLLKHGEPDLDSVAKIVLTDWVRGRIPFFVPPPESDRPMEVPGVKQNLKTLIQKNTFLPEDIEKLDEEEEAVGEGNEGEASLVEEDQDQDGEGEEEEEELRWNDVFEGIKTSEPMDEEIDADVDIDADADDDASETEAKKEARMKTNKRKAENFYTSANVKNKSRSKAALMKSLPVGKKGGSKSRKG